MVLDDVIAANQVWARGRSPRPLADDGGVGVAVVSCYDPRLDAILVDALGLVPGQAVLLRTAGARIPRSGDPLRSLALACFRYGIRDVLVVGHSTCRMAAFNASDFIDRFRSRGVPRSAFGDEDLRAWVGAEADPRSGVLASLAAIREAPFLPKDLVLAGAVLDESTGLLEIVHRDAVSAPVPFPAEPEREGTAPVEAAAPRETGVPEPDEDAVVSAFRLIDTLQSKARLRDEALRLRTEVERASHPIEKLRLVEAFLRRAGGDAREIREAVLDLRRRAAGTPAAEIAEEVVRRLGETAREKRT